MYKLKNFYFIEIYGIQYEKGALNFVLGKIWSRAFENDRQPLLLPNVLGLHLPVVVLSVWPSEH